MKNIKLLISVFIITLLMGCESQNLDVTPENVSKLQVTQTSRIVASINSYAPDGYSLTWEDNFDGTALNSDNWFVGCKDPVSGDMIPGANGDYLLGPGYAGYITEEDSYVENGSLILRNQKRTYQGTSPAGTYDYTTGWVTSMHRVYLNKGYVEVKAKFPVGDKVWPAIWLVSEDLVWGPEWDLWEYFGYRSSSVGYDAMGCHLMTGTYPTTRWYSHFLKPFDGDYDAEAWHVYGFEWTATYAKWYIDGNLVHTLNASSVIEWPDEDMYIILNNEIKNDSPDDFTVYPNSLEIDYIQIYQPSVSSTVSLTNGDFETGSTAPWGKYGTSSISATNQHSGSYCAFIGADNSGYEYTISGLSPNTTYTFQGYVKSGNGQVVNISAKEYGGSQVTAATTNTTYTLLSVTFTTGATNTSAKLCFFRWGNGAGTAYGDDFKIYKSIAFSNGNFESGSVSPWTKYGTSSVSSTNQHSGNYCAYIGADYSGYEYVISDLKPNTSYTFRGYVKSTNGSQVNISAKDFGGSQVATSTTNSSYTELSVTFTTGASNTSAKICFFKWGNGAGQAYGDDFEVFEN